MSSFNYEIDNLNQSFVILDQPEEWRKPASTDSHTFLQIVDLELAKEFNIYKVRSHGYPCMDALHDQLYIRGVSEDHDKSIIYGSCVNWEKLKRTLIFLKEREKEITIYLRLLK